MNPLLRPIRRSRRLKSSNLSILLLRVGDVYNERHIRNLRCSPANVEQRSQQSVIEKNKASTVVARPLAEQGLVKSSEERWDDQDGADDVPHRAATDCTVLRSVRE